MGRSQDAEAERVMSTHLSPFFDAEQFSEQFGTPEARTHMLDGLTKADFVEIRYDHRADRDPRGFGVRILYRSVSL
jgi:hypothetical protein